ncbi:MAG: antibiotic biosynthesis monooxygenase family protein [Alphaproteobacteria bacterium]
MFARINRFEVADGKSAELQAAYKKTIDIVKQEKGFQEAILMIEPETGQVVSVTLWDTKENMERTGRPGAGTLLEKILPIVRPFQKAPPVHKHYDVKLRVK